MTRWAWLSIGAVALCAAWLAAPAALTAGGGRRLEAFRVGGGRLGVVLEDVDGGDVARLKLAEERGAVVKEVSSEGPAQKAGLKEGDVILRYQGETVHSAAQLSRMVRETPPGRKVALEVSRDGALQRIAATLEERRGEVQLSDGEMHLDVPIPPLPPVPRIDELRERTRGHVLREMLLDSGQRKLGIEYQEISGQLARYFRVAGETGLLVASVDEDGPAGKAGIKAGDVILKVGGKGVRDGGELRDEVARLKPGEEATITVQRDGKTLELKVKVGGRAERRKEGDPV